MEGARPATPEDVARVAELYRLACEEMYLTRGGTVLFLREARRDPIEGSLAAEVADPDRGVWVGTIDGVVVGYVAGRIEDLSPDNRLGVIEDLFVEPEARSVGVGEALANAIIAWFESRGCSGADAMALPGARATKNFFEETGFTARLLVMHRRFATAADEPGQDGPGSDIAMPADAVPEHG